MPFRAIPEEDTLPVLMPEDNMCHVTPKTCLWGCGNQCAHPAPNETENDTFQAIASRYFSRRKLLGAGAVAAGMLVIGRGDFLKPGEAQAAEAGGAAAGETGLTFTPIALSSEDRVVAPPGYKTEILIRWGDPLFLDPDSGFDFANTTAAKQERQFGYNNDYLGFISLAENRALLIANHDYTNPELMFTGYSPESPTKEQVDVELAAHGLTVLHIERHRTRGWRYTLGAWHNRRITGTTNMMLTGPAAGHSWMKTSEDPTGFWVSGTLNNCSAGITPWGTVLTCEENFNQYFANNDFLTDKAKQDVHKRYGLTAKASSRKWEKYYSRFDISAEPNEPFRFGWVVEFDPHDSGSLPKKHTALGRFKHEATSTVIASDGRAVVYMGDDERFDYMYKFVSAGKYSADDRAANMNLLESGTLYVPACEQPPRPHAGGSGPKASRGGARQRCRPPIGSCG